jgi:hypothetical protein
LEGTSQRLLRPEGCRRCNSNKHPRFVHGLFSANEIVASSASIYLFSVLREKCVAQRQKKSEIFKMPHFDKRGWSFNGATSSSNEATGRGRTLESQLESSERWQRRSYESPLVSIAIASIERP